MTDPTLAAVRLLDCLDDIPQIAFAYRDDGLMVALNTASERLLGVPRSALVGRLNLFENREHMDPRLYAGYEAAFRGEPQVIPVTEIRIARARNIDAEGRRGSTWVETLLVPLARRPDGTAAYVLGIQRDVTELIGARDQIDAANRQIDVQRETIATLAAAKREIEAQKATIQALSTPVIEVWDGIVTLPLLGAFDPERAATMTSQLLDAVVRTRARDVILDLTGLAVIDAAAADLLLRLVAAVTLLGARGTLVGIRPDTARLLVDLGADLGRLRTHQTLRDALKACLQAP